MSDVLPDTRVFIRNMLEIRPGGIIMVPGCEPVSSQTSLALATNMKCNASFISVQKALQVIPGSRVIRGVMTPYGQNGTGMFFTLPEGPPPDGYVCPKDCPPDWYAILRANAGEPEQQQGPEECAGFNYTGCQLDQEPGLMAPDFTKRPNSEPLGNIL